MSPETQAEALAGLSEAQQELLREPKLPGLVAAPHRGLGVAAFARGAVTPNEEVFRTWRLGS